MNGAANSVVEQLYLRQVFYGGTLRLGRRREGSIPSLQT